MNAANQTISGRQLKKAAKVSPEGVRRLAKWLRLRVQDQMSTRQVAALVRWRLTRDDIKYL